MSYMILSGCRIVPTVDGPKEDHANPCDLETRLYFEQQIDLGDAVLTHLVDVEGSLEAGPGSYTHRLISETGGVFHVKVAEGEREWPVIGLPPALAWVKAANDELDQILQRMQTMMLANRLLEAECKAWREWWGQSIDPDMLSNPWPDGVER